MSFTVGDIVWCNTSVADHAKYHICVLECSDDGQAACFLFLNSETGWKGDCVFENADFPCLPASKTGKSVVSFSLLPRYNPKQLKLYGAKKVGELNPAIARKLEAFAKTVPTLTAAERKIVLNGLSKIK